MNLCTHALLSTALIKFNFHIYYYIHFPHYTEVPTIYYTSYTDLTSDLSTDFLAKLECRSQRSIPTNVTWWRNGIEVDIDDGSYQIVQRVVQQRSSYFQNTLLIKDLFGALGNHSYTCSVENHFGNDSETVTFNKKGNSYIACNVVLFSINISFRNQFFFIENSLWRQTHLNLPNF